MLRTILQSKLFQYCSISSSASNDPCFPKISDSVPVVLLFHFVSFLPNLNDLFCLLYLKRFSCQLRGRNDEYEKLQECETALVCDRVVFRGHRFKCGHEVGLSGQRVGFAVKGSVSEMALVLWSAMVKTLFSGLVMALVIWSIMGLVADVSKF